MQRLEAFLGEVPTTVLPLLLLQERFDLDAETFALLMLAAAPAFDPQIGQRYALLNQQPEQLWPSLALLQNIMTHAGLGTELVRLLDPAGPLMRYRLVAMQRTFPDLPDAWQPLQLDPRMLRYLRGELTLDADLAACVEMVHELPPARDRFFLPEAERDRWQGLIDRVAVRDRLIVVVLRGPAGLGRRRRALELARQQERALVCADLGALRDTFGHLPSALRLVRREALFQDADICLTGWEALTTPLDAASDDPGRIDVRASLHARLSRELSIGLDGHIGPVTVIVDGSATPAPTLPGIAAIDYAPAPLDADAARRLWRFVLPRHLRQTDLDLDGLAATYRLTPGQIHDAVDGACDPDQPELPVETDALRRAIKDGITHRLGLSAHRVERTWGFEDLVLPPDVLLQIEEFVHRHHYRDQVLQGWGMARRFGADLGLSALFEGPPGTGKTMSASVTAGALGLDLYQVDLSRVVSRYIGETEKNLGHIFDEAELAQAMLLFDEADALFAKRTEVKSSNDRYANMEVNYLLQRLETFSGVVILTSNFGASIDDAFARRLSLRITFPTPTRTERERLWRSMLQSGELPLGAIDFAALAESWELAGGHIRNAVLRAAFLAAARKRKVDQQLLELAARLEMRSQGMLVKDVAGDDER